ncbi:DNA glycosylase AlkZ-like family protein [Spelaeicoccus albus]|uniref:Winged helix-turn-helix domain-containing protein n=1 Tax=Spelaeicoccus albus TaxID=1280376 RepID=A0A7Z0A8W8_9MICO|nr:crosslink repair DNA glycosylase YcaQ family protein [Spelaeicoccus albus]NYI66539.1 hypothetical protein [Spelaeicoccus albus]
MHRLSRVDARRIAVRAQLLTSRRPASLADAVRGLTLLQIDPTAAVAPSADLVAWSRLGSAYSPDALESALSERTLLELRGMIRPAEDIALYSADMNNWPGTGKLSPWQQIKGDWVAANETFRRDILARLTDSGPLPAADLPDTCVKPWRSSGWNNKRNVGQMLEMLEERGEIAVAGRRNGQRVWDTASRVYPDLPVVPADEAKRIRDEKRLRALGLARSRGPECRVEPDDVGDAGEPAVVDGVRGTWRVDPSLLDEEFEGRIAILSPLDRLLYDRKRMSEIFAFDFALEKYKPKAKRRWGYYALPIMHGDRFVGKIDATADRKAGVLRVDAVHEDEAFSRTLRAGVDRQLDDLARCLRLDLQMAC